MQQLYAPQIKASMCLRERADLREDKRKELKTNGGKE